MRAKWVAVIIFFLFSLSLMGQQPPVPPPQPSQDSANPQGQDVDESDDKEAPETNEPTVKLSVIRSYLAPFDYDRDSLRDPFESQTATAPLKPGQVYGPFLGLQNYQLKDLKLKGLLWNTNKPVAIFQDPDKREHRLRVKDYVGENFGYIATIREKEVVVIQTIEEDNKRYSTTKVVFLNE